MVQDTTPVEVDGQGKGSFINFSSIGTRLVFTIVVLVLIPAAVIAAVTVYNNIQSGRQQSFNQLESVATLKDAQIHGWVEELEESLAAEVNDRTLSLIPFVLPDSGFSRVQEDSIERLREIFQESVSGEVKFEEIFLMGLDGTVLVSSSEDAEGTTLSDLSGIEQALQEPYVGPIRFGELFETTRITLLQPVFEGEEVLALIGSYANLNEFNSIMAERSGLGDTGETYLVDANFMLVTDSRFEGYPTGVTMVSTDAVENAIASQGIGEASYDDYRGESVFGVYHWIPELDVTLIAQRDQSEALGSTFTTLRANVAVAALAVLVAVVVGYLFVRTISTPLSDLTKTATRIAS
jgi:methyl-accepting chemotaxis protein